MQSPIVTLVTAASSNHFKTLRLFLHRLGHPCRVIVYDIGLKTQEVEELKTKFSYAEFRTFDFSKYPPWMHIDAQDAGAYAWKPVIVAEVAQETEGMLIWSDAGNYIQRLDEALVKCFGRVCSTEHSAGTIRDWTHPDSSMAMGVTGDLLDKPMRNAAFVVFDLRLDESRAFVSSWASLSLKKEIIQPEGASRDNHRQDQSVLTGLFFLHDLPDISFDDAVLYHNDCDETTLGHRLAHTNLQRETDLCRIMNRFGSDKGNYHNYTKIYTKLMVEYIGEACSLFELGIGTQNQALASHMPLHCKPGGSLRGWKEWLRNARVWGADIDRDILFEEDGISTRWVDQTRADTIQAMWRDLPDMDIIVEDGLHTWVAQKLFLLESWHKVKPGGLYITEDVAPVSLPLLQAELQGLQIKLGTPILVLRIPGGPPDNILLVMRKPQS